VTETRQKYAVIMAGGHGLRMGSDTPKQFLLLGGKTILQRTIEKFVKAVPDVKIVTVLPKECMQIWKNICVSDNFIVPQILAVGGITRFHSVKNALAKIPDGSLVAIHDGVRPLISQDLIKKMFAKMENIRALIPVIPMTDTLKCLKKLENGDLETIDNQELDRSIVYGAQTPQMFYSEDIKSAYRQAYDTSFTDDASVALKKGISLSYILGERYNIKITEPSDLKVAEALWNQAN